MNAAPARHPSSEVRSGLKMAVVNHPYINRAGMTARRTIVAQMADDLRVMAANSGCVLEDDLVLLGWRRAQLATYGAAARERAIAKAAGKSKEGR